MIRVKNNFRAAPVMSKMRSAIGLYAHTASKKMEGEAKKKAPWKDRTANARNSIQGDFGWEGNSCRVVLSGNVEYFVYLELAHGKRYAVLVPTVHKSTPEVLRGYQRLVK